MSKLQDNINMAAREISGYISDAIQNGAEVNRGCGYALIDGVFIGEEKVIKGYNARLLVYMRVPELGEVWKTESLDTLTAKRAELQLQLNETEEKINQLKQRSNETDNN